MLIVTGYVYVDPTNLAECIADLKSLAETARRRVGNLSYDAALDDPEVGRLLIAERWADQAALTAHLEAGDTVTFLNRWQRRIRADIRKYDASNERDLMDD